MRTSTAFFAGIGTVIVAVTAGLGGGILLGDIMSPPQPKHPSSEVTRLEQQRKSPPPVSAMNGASQPVPYMATPQVAAAVAEPAPQQKQAEAPPQPQPQPQQAAAQPADVKPAPAAVQPASTEQPAAKERAAPEDSLAKARDAEVKREPRRADDRRKAERRQQWAERRRIKPRDDELRDVEASVRQATEPRSFFGEPRIGSRVGLFEQD